MGNVLETSLRHVAAHQDCYQTKTTRALQYLSANQDWSFWFWGLLAPLHVHHTAHHRPDRAPVIPKQESDGTSRLKDSSGVALINRRVAVPQRYHVAFAKQLRWFWIASIYKRVARPRIPRWLLQDNVSVQTAERICYVDFQIGVHCVTVLSSLYNRSGSMDSGFTSVFRCKS